VNQCVTIITQAYMRSVWVTIFMYCQCSTNQPCCCCYVSPSRHMKCQAETPRTNALRCEFYTRFSFAKQQLELVVGLTKSSCHFFDTNAQKVLVLKLRSCGASQICTNILCRSIYFNRFSGNQKDCYSMVNTLILWTLVDFSVV